MTVRILALLLLLMLLPAHAGQRSGLPEGFVFLRQAAPDILQDIRYHGSRNFLARPVKGYEAPECILTAQAATALAAVNRELASRGLKLLVYDCYRPERAVLDFVAWSRDTADQAAKTLHYPGVDKLDFFVLGYVAERSGHSRGSTVDLTIVPAGFERPLPPRPGLPAPCTAPHGVREDDGSLDMGTNFDCMDPLSHPLTGAVSPEARANRMLLRGLMEKHGFKPLEEEWWHFTLRQEPFPDTYFDFPVTAP